MNKKSIIFIIIAVILAIVGFSAMNTSEQTDAISKAVYVEDGKVLPENEGKIVIFGGGEPLEVEGKIIGALGVSGGTAEQDTMLAAYGKEILKEVISCL